MTSPRAAQVASQVARSVVQVVATAYGTDRLSGVVNLQRLVGAGTIVDEAGYILTSASLVNEAMQVDVVLSGDGSDARRPAAQTLPAALVGIVEDLDLAVMRVDASGLPALALARQPVHQGDRTVTVLPGASGAHGVAAGIVLATGAPVRQDSPVPYLVTDAPRGVAGAPVVNMDGELVGLAAAFVERGGTTASATAALPVALLDAAMAQAQSSMPWRRGVIGLAAESVTHPCRRRTTRDRSTAQLVVSRVSAGLPADRAGIREGDVIVAVNHQPVARHGTGHAVSRAVHAARRPGADARRRARARAYFELTPTAVSVVDLLASRSELSGL